MSTAWPWRTASSSRSPPTASAGRSGPSSSTGTAPPSPSDGPGRRLFPDCWDIVGGHVEPGESLLDTLAREVAEETGRHLRRVRRHLGTSTPLTAGSAPTTSPASRRTGPPVSTSSTT
ncbi:NUDIX hydrolase [Streptomyces sp. KN37]|uniref:NUDIX hydrolase n=1 Tax=Streptomyces sp. KN37 TaxID=3090667 RepID=UPI002A74A8F5|nr:NUDIX hydrolase [Streptomyces sp. KN37]WPO69906.1 NUDIX hydrolase [Streptomyces sp. KN37]